MSKEQQPQLPHPNLYAELFQRATTAVAPMLGELTPEQREQIAQQCTALADWCRAIK